MKEQRITPILHELAEQEVPDSLDLWPAIQARLRPQQPVSRWARIRPASRLAWALMALGLFLVLGAAAYAVAPVLTRLLQMDPSLQDVEQAGLFQELNLSQNVGGLTVTLQRAYADANRIVVAYTVSSPAGQRYDPGDVTLTDATGTVFPGMAGIGVTGKSDLLQVELPPGTGSYVTSFDAAAVQGAPAELRLRLTLKLEEIVLPTPVPNAPPTADSRPAEPPPSIVVTLEPMPRGTLVGPFTFDFSVPFIPGRVALVRESARVAGVTVQLERVVVTPSETRAVLCFDPPDGESERWVPVATLETGDGRNAGTGASAGLIVSGATIERAGCYRYSFLVPLADWHGEWKLAVTELVGMDPTRPDGQTRIQGPWVFRFHVP